MWDPDYAGKLEEIIGGLFDPRLGSPSTVGEYDENDLHIKLAINPINMPPGLLTIRFRDSDDWGWLEKEAKDILGNIFIEFTNTDPRHMDVHYLYTIDMEGGYISTITDITVRVLDYTTS